LLGEKGALQELDTRLLQLVGVIQRNLAKSVNNPGTCNGNSTCNALSGGNADCLQVEQGSKILK
jgi:hypothetical protein